MEQDVTVGKRNQHADKNRQTPLGLFCNSQFEYFGTQIKRNMCVLDYIDPLPCHVRQKPN